MQAWCNIYLNNIKLVTWQSCMLGSITQTIPGGTHSIGFIMRTETWLIIKKHIIVSGQLCVINEPDKNALSSGNNCQLLLS